VYYGPSGGNTRGYVTKCETILGISQGGKTNVHNDYDNLFTIILLHITYTQNHHHTI